MEVVSAISSVVGIADVTIRLIKYLKEVKEAIQTIEEDIDLLIAEIETLQSIHASVEEQFLRHVNSKESTAELTVLWEHTGKTLEEGQRLTRKLEVRVREIYGDNPKVSSKGDAFMKQHRKRSRENVISALREQIHRCHTNEQKDDMSVSVKQLLAAVGDLKQEIKTQSEATPSSHVEHDSDAHADFVNASQLALQRMASSVNAVEQCFTQTSTNRYYDTPVCVDRFYTGREYEADELRNYFFQDQQPQQKRFVIYGVGGSGKTQFCCKFATDYRERFWGVFWVDARSRQRLKQTLSENVARLAGVDANENAALHWLSNLEKRWLLLIDNADDPAISLDGYLPKGNRGHVLITTRNPSNKSYGNVGPGFFELHGMEDSAASSLLLKAAGQTQPWDKTITNWAFKIARALGHLALAISVAGSSIREGFCHFHDYLDYHEERRLKRLKRSRASYPGVALDVETRSAETVEATFDISYRAIANRGGEDARDALQLLKMFAFLHCENIRFDFLERCVTNAAVEAKQQIADREHERALKAPTRRLTWSHWTNDQLMNMLTFIYRNRSLPTLPDVLRTGRTEGHFNKTRVRKAMHQLTQCSLVKHNTDNMKDTYSMHPLVHEWAREAPDMSFGEQNVWAEAAAVFLSSCVLLPPLVVSTEDEALRKDLLPHVDQVRDFQCLMEQRMKDKRMARMKPWPVLEGGFDRERALMYAKFSIVYAHNGRWEDAKRLQTAVKDFTTKVFGLRHAATRRIHLALAGTLLQLGESDNAAKLQEQVLEACLDLLGPKHHETLVAKQNLGESRYLQGRFSDALTLQEEAVAELEKKAGLDDEDLLSATDYLGRTVAMFYRDEDFRRARRLHQTAVDGLRKVLGRDHFRTLVACENLCCVATKTECREHLEEALEMMTEVFETRKDKLGKEHGYTLLSMVNLALVKMGLGDLTGAEELMITALPIAQRNYGSNHIAYLWGRCKLALIYVRQERWEETEQLLLDVTERQKYLLQGRGRQHPDRIGGLIQLAAALNVLGKYEQCERVADEALEALDAISTREHPLAKKLKDDRDKWREARSKHGNVSHG